MAERQSPSPAPAGFPPIELPIAPPYPAMEAKLVDALPERGAWQYEPKWDGFRCLAFRDGDAVALQSKAGQPLARYFPEIVAALGSLGAARFVLDGEIVIPRAGGLSFEDLLLRIHPSESRVRKLAAETPAAYLVFDLLVEEGRSVAAEPLAERRRRLEAFAARHFAPDGRILLSPATRDPAEARRWLAGLAGSDGVVAKRADLAYRSGERTGMEKVKRVRTADCVVGGFRYASGARVVGSLLLGLYDDEGLLHYVGHVSAFDAARRRELTGLVEPLVEPPGFTGGAPGGPSRWTRGRSTEWVPLRPLLVVEVTYHHVTGGHIRHGAQLVRFRPEKSPRQCTLDQLEGASEERVAPPDVAPDSI